MIDFQRLKQKRMAFQSFSGLRVAAFDELLPCFERAYEADLDKRDVERESQVQRERGGALRHAEDKLLFILF